MAIIRFTERPFFRNPWSEFERLRREMDTFSRWFDSEIPGNRGAEVFPPLNVSEDKDTVFVRAELPGVDPENLELSVEGDTLVLKGQRSACPTDDATSYHRREIQCGRFSRAITLPTRVDVEKIVAESRNGILKVTLPKAEEVKPRKIKVDIA